MVAGVIGVLIGGIVVAGYGRPRLAAASDAIAALVATFIATMVSAWLLPLSLKLVVLSALIVLVPGMSLTNAVRELTSQHLASGVARFAGAAHLRQTGGQYVWDVAFWGQRGAMLAEESLPLRFSMEDDRLMFVGDTFAKNIDEAGRLAPDEARVIVSRAAVACESALPPRWEVVDDNDAVVAAARRARSGPASAGRPCRASAR